MHEKWSRQLTASGNEGRWNSKGQLVIYCSSSRALACLENMVHRGGEGNSNLYKTMIIEMPDYIAQKEILLSKLMFSWRERNNFSYTQELGDEWISSNATVVLKIPSAIIPEESNYILNTQHKDFSKIRLRRVENFYLDSRVITESKKPK